MLSVVEVRGGENGQCGCDFTQWYIMGQQAVISLITGQIFCAKGYEDQRT